MNAAAFAATFAVLAGSNLQDLRAMAAASIRLSPSEMPRTLHFNIPAVADGQAMPALPAIPARFDAELVLEAPQVTAEPILPAAKTIAGREILATPIAFAAPPKAISKPKPKKSLPFGLFGALEFRTNAKAGIDAWRKALAHIDNEQPLYAFCDTGMLNCPPKYLAWRKLLASLKGLPPAQQLARLNRAINALIRHGDDRDIFRVRDHWASPMQFLDSGGDCEDYTILKYASLLELGYSDAEMRIAVVKDTKRRLDHAVLAVSTDHGVIVLDNVTDEPVLHDRILHYRPVYSVNRNNRWVHIATRQISRIYAANSKN